MLARLPILLVVCLLLPMLAGVSDAEACECTVPADPCSAADRTPVIFVGHVLSSRGTTFQLQVDEVIKGRVERAVEIVQAAMSCNPFMKTGRTYLVYARDIGGKLVTGLCTRTAEISD